MKTRTIYSINQGTARRQSDGTLTNYDLNKAFETSNKEEALAKFEDVKTDTTGWVHDVVITELVECRFIFDEESEEWVEDEEFNYSGNNTLEYFECDK